MQQSIRAWPSVTARIALVVLGGYAASAAVVAALAVLLAMCGLSRIEAVVLASLLGFPIYLLLLLWGFAEHRFKRFALTVTLLAIAGLGFAYVMRQTLSGG